MTKTAVYL